MFQSIRWWAARNAASARRRQLPSALRRPTVLRLEELEVRLTPSTYNIDTAAGNHTAGSSGDGGPALTAELNTPYAVAVDGAGDLFIADTLNNVVREVNAATGKISTVAGNNTAGYSGDGGSALTAQLNTPVGVAVDGAGDLFIADYANYVIREVKAGTGVISTVAGNNTAGYSGDGGSALTAQLNTPTGVAVDAGGNLFIADLGNNVIREVKAGTGVISTVAGNHTAGFSGDGGPALTAQLNSPFAVAVDGAGDLYIADYLNNVVREVNGATGVISTEAGNHTAGYSGDGGPALTAELNSPVGVAVDGAGNLFIGDYANNVVREVKAATGYISTVAGNHTAGYSGDGGPALVAQLGSPIGVALDGAGDLFVADAINSVVRKLTPQATQLAVTTPPPAAVGVGSPFSLTVSAEDDSGKVIANFHGSVTLTLSVNPGGATLGGTVTVTAVNGVATFSGLTLNAAGAGYVIQAAASGLAVAATSPISVLTPDQLYVNAVYEAALGRAPDAGELASWSTQLDGGLPRSTFANAITHSAEYYTNLIDSKYEQYLSRLPDAQGLAYWLSQLEGGLSDEHLEASFFSSAEYIANHGGLTAAWVDGVYMDELGRPTDPTGQSYFLGQIAAGVSAADLTFQFASSPEREGQRIAADYLQYLNRPLDAVGQAYWVDQFENHGASNENVVAGFLASDEYFGEHSS